MMTAIDIETFAPKGKRISPSEREALAAMGYKWCPKCRSVKRLEEFSADRAQTDGLECRCRSCSNAKRADWDRRNPERIREKDRRSDQKRTANLMRAKAVLERAVDHFEGRHGWLSLIAHRVDRDPDASQRLQFLSLDIDGLIAEYVYEEA